MKTKNRLKSIAAASAALLMTASGIALSAAPAQADFDCNSTVCLWWDGNYKSYKQSYSGDVSYVGDWFNDQASSAHNRANRQINLFINLNYSGQWLTLDAGEAVGYIGNYWLVDCVGTRCNWDNQTSSVDM